MSNLAPLPAEDAAERLDYGRWLAPGCAAAAICLGLALQISNGILHPAALSLVVIAFALLIGTAVTPRPERAARLDARIVPLLGAAGLVLHLLCLYTSLPGLYLKLDRGGLAPFHWGLGILAALAGSAVIWRKAGWTKPLQIGTLLAVHCALGVWMIHRSPDPAIDVHMFHRYAIAALRSGVNPYADTLPDIYRNSTYYGRGVSVDGRLQFGFPYFPLSLLISMFGQVFGRDPRYAQLAAIELAAMLMAFARPRSFGPIAAALYLTTPRIFFVLEQSWTEPFLVLGLSAVIFAACRHSRLVPWLFGAFIFLKQYLVFAVPAAMLLVEWPFDRRKLATFLAKSTLLGAAVTLPFVAWNPGAFWTSVVTLQIRQPFRIDALSVLSWWVSRGHEQPPVLISVVAAAAASALALWRVPRTPAGFGAAISLTFMAFFVFNKQAFCNYYFFVIGALYAAVAAWRPPDAREAARDLRPVYSGGGATATMDIQRTPSITRRVVGGLIMFSLVFIGSVTTAAAQPAAGGARRAAVTRLEIAPGTRASYRVREQLLGFNFPNDAVGTTQSVSGSITIAPDGTIAGGSKITVDVRTLKSDDERRDNYLRDRTLQAGESPLAEFVARRLTGTPLPIPTAGKATLQLVGDMSVHRTTSEIVWAIDATFGPDRITGQARTNFPFAKFGLVLPRLPGLLSVDDNIRLELDLVLQRRDAS